MPVLGPGGSGPVELPVRIVFWGIAGAGVSTNLSVIRDKLRADHRGDLRSFPTALDPTTHYEMLPIELGQVNGLRTRLQVVGLPGGVENAATRKQLLDHVDGVVLIVDSQPHLLDENVQSLAELRDSLSAYGRSLAELPVVVEYNKRDLSDPYTIEELHRRLSVPGAAVFEAVAPQGTGVLQALTTISKRVIRVLRESDFGAPPADVEPAVPAVVEGVETADATPVSQAELMEAAILAEGDALDEEEDEVSAAAAALDQPWDAISEELKDETGARIGADFEVVSVGTATKHGARGVRIPLVLGNPAGETVTLALKVELDPLVDDAGE